MAGHQPDGAPRAADAGLSVLQVALLALHALFMLGVCLRAGVLPARRAFRLEPTEALRVD